MTKTCQVTADSDPQRSWMTVQATSVFHAAVYYCGAAAGRGGGFPDPKPGTIITVRVDGRQYFVREERARAWANAKAEQDRLRRLNAGKKPGRA